MKQIRFKADCDMKEVARLNTNLVMTRKTDTVHLRRQIAILVILAIGTVCAAYGLMMIICRLGVM